jgi:hypothetical protein
MDHEGLTVLLEAARFSNYCKEHMENAQQNSCSSHPRNNSSNKIE